MIINYYTAVIRSGAIGDLLQIVPALREYRRQNPNEVIVLFCGESCADAIRNSPYIDKVITFNDNNIYNSPIMSKLSETYKIYSQLKGFNKCFVLHDDKRWTYLAKLAGIKNICSIYSAAINIHRRFRYLATMADSDEIDISYEFHPDPQKIETPLKPYVVISAGGARNIKNDNECRRWNGFNKLIEKILSETVYSIVMVGLEADRVDLYSSRIIDLCGKTSLSDAYHIINNASAFIGNDSGLLHLASCTDTKKIGVFTSTDPNIVFGKNSDIISLKSDLECSPCEKHGNFYSKCMNECVDSINAESVFNELITLLQEEFQSETLLHPDC